MRVVFKLNYWLCATQHITDLYCLPYKIAKSCLLSHTTDSQWNITILLWKDHFDFQSDQNEIMTVQVW